MIGSTIVIGMPIAAVLAFGIVAAANFSALRSPGSTPFGT